MLKSPYALTALLLLTPCRDIARTKKCTLQMNGPMLLLLLLLLVLLWGPDIDLSTDLPPRWSV